MESAKDNHPFWGSPFKDKPTHEKESEHLIFRVPCFSVLQVLRCFLTLEEVSSKSTP